MRIKKLHPDMIDESTFSTKDPHRVMYYIVKCMTDTLRHPDPHQYARNLDADAQKAFAVGAETIDQDGIFRTFVGTYLAYRSDPERRQYVISKDFFDVFRETTLENVQFRHLPRNCAGYVELPYPLTDDDGEKFSGFYFAALDSDRSNNPILGRSREHKCLLVFAYETENHTYGTLHGATENTDEGLAVSLKEQFDQHAVRTLVSFELENTEVRMNYTPITALLFNILVYLNSGQPDLRTYRNEIRRVTPTSTKIVRADKELSLQEITLVGWGFKKPPLYTSDGWYSRAHMGWRRCGPGRTQLRWTYISQSREKHWREKIEDDDET